MFALRQVFSLTRGSGKTFITHLVGTASLVRESGCPEYWVIGALLHALHQHRVPFESSLAPEERRAVLADRFGTQVAELVRRYTSFESEDLAAFMGAGAAVDIDVLTLRLADKLEDVCGYALALHGNTGTDDLGLRGGYPWRRDTKTAEAATIIKLILRLRLDDLHRSFSHWLDFESTPAALAEMCTGWQNRVSILIAR